MDEQYEVPVAVPAEEKAVQEDPNKPVSLTHFCVHLSMIDKRPHMIGAFNHAEARAKRLMDSTANYKARYAAFLVQPA